MKFLKKIDKTEIVETMTRTASKCGYKLKKASPTIMIVGAAIGGVTATVLACKATIKAQDILTEHNARVESIHTAKQQIESGEIQLSEGETYTEKDYKSDITTTYVQTGLKLAKVYAPAVTLGAVSLGCMFGSHHIMSKRNASLTAAYIALDKAFEEYKSRVSDRFGSRVQEELEHNIKAKSTNEQGVEETIKEYKDIAMQHTSPYTCIFDETVDTWQPDNMLNRNYLFLMEQAANKRLRIQGHLFLNDVLASLGTHGGVTMKTPEGQIVGWLYDPNDPTRQNHVDFGVTNYVKGDEALNSFINGGERSVMLRFNCDGPIIDKI
ncbi:MAG: hypothetical protein BHV90_00080 [Clostridiales bacterium 42_27]|nr:MAG: hypothetical protein BHV90_00080 [Clostridiales bacterium 42_27]